MTGLIRVNRLASPVTTLGPGTRVALWVQGCTIGCLGCASQDTWAADGGAGWEIEALAACIVDTAADVGATGVTITGGEPFQQAAQVTQLIRRVRALWRAGSSPDVLIFTGYAAAAAHRRDVSLWQAADVIVAGPYRRDRPSEHPLLGSDNQSIELISELGRARIASIEPGRRQLQVSVDGGDLSIIGLPDPGDLVRLQSALAARGIELAHVSWESEEAS